MSGAEAGDNALSPELNCLAQAVYFEARGEPLDGQLAVARVLGRLLARSVEQIDCARGVDAVVPVPLHAARHAGRGFNQSAEIARWVARQIRRPLAPRLVVRHQATRPQVGLRLAQRQANLRAAFVASTDVAGLRIVVIDDVTTTGSTLHEIAATLQAAGALAIDAWCVARADRREIRTAGLDERSPGEGGMR